MNGFEKEKFDGVVISEEEAIIIVLESERARGGG